MKPDSGMAALQSESSFRELLEIEVKVLRERLMGIGNSWNQCLGTNKRPELPLPFGRSDPTTPIPQVKAPSFDYEGMDVLSLDVFDTCIRRICGTPQSVFHMMERRLALEGSPIEAFSVIRVEEELRIRQAVLESGSKEDVSLLEIYQALADRFSWSSEEMKSRMLLEVDLEQSVLVANEGIRDLAHEAQAKHLKVVYTTEMYLPVSVLEHVLIKAGFPVEKGALFASGETGLSKGSGRLFQRLKEAFPGKHILHVGDNPESDVEAPRRLGLASWPVPRMNPPYEDALSNSLLKIVEEGDKDAPFWEHLGYRVVGPLTAAWIKAMVEEADQRGLTQLLFLTRDGYFPLKAFDQFRDQYGLKMEGQTCFSSRRMLALAAMDTISAGDWDFLLKPAPGLRVKDFFSRLHIGPDLFEPLCLRAGWDPETIVCHHRGFHDPSMKDRLYELLLEVIDAFYALRDGLRQRYCAYFSSLNLGSKDFGFVDIGWNGSSLEGLNRLLGPNVHPIGFYLGLWRSRQSESLFSERSSSFFISGESFAAEEQLLRGGVGLMEFLLGSPFESVMDVRLEGAQWEPVFADPGILGPYGQQAYKGMNKGFDRFMNRFLESNGFLMRGSGKAFLNEILQRLVYDPKADERLYLGQVSHSEGWGVSRPFRLLPSLEGLKSPEQRILAYCYSGWKAAWRNLDYA